MRRKDSVPHIRTECLSGILSPNVKLVGMITVRDGFPQGKVSQPPLPSLVSGAPNLVRKQFLRLGSHWVEDLAGKELTLA